jgi:integrase
VRDLLTHLTRDRQVSASTQNQALAALLFLYRHVLEQPMAAPSGTLQAKRPVRLPVVVTREKVRRVLNAMDRAQLAVAVGVAGIDAVSGSRMW